VTPRATIAILNWNGGDFVGSCIESILGQSEQDIEVVVVDNGSSDGSADMVRTDYPGVHVIASTNRGFAAGNNLGIAHSHSRYLLLLNPDTEIVDDALAVLLDYMDAHPKVGAAGPQLRYPDGSLQSSRRRFPTPLTGFFESTPLGRCLPRNRWASRYYVLDRPDDVESEVDWLMGAALLVRREAAEQAGPLDEGYFMYSEEMEWCYRIKQHGWQVVYLPAATVVHHEGRSSEQVAAARHIYFETSKLRYYRQVHGPAWALALRVYLLAGYAWEWGIEGAKWLVGHKRPLRAARLAAYGQVLRSGLPPAGARGAGQR